MSVLTIIGFVIIVIMSALAYIGATAVMCICADSLLERLLIVAFASLMAIGAFLLVYGDCLSK